MNRQRNPYRHMNESLGLHVTVWGGERLEIRTLLIPIPAVLIRTIDISPLVRRYSTCLRSTRAHTAFAHCPETLYAHVV
jgi:hypothetical protein